MKYHELTEKISNEIGIMSLSIKENMDTNIRAHMKKKCDALLEGRVVRNGNIVCSFQEIQNAFGTSEPTLEEKIEEIRKKHDGHHSSAERCWEALIQEIIRTVREHDTQ